jgi:hypothetical protein
MKKLNWFEYWIGHCWMSGWQSINSTFRIWADLMTNNFDDYALSKEDDPFTECYEWFWGSLGEDNTYPKEFLEYLYEIAEDAIKHPENLVYFSSADELMDSLESDTPSPKSEKN